MTYASTPLRLRVGGGEWQLFAGEEARNLDYAWQHRADWTTNLDAVLALRSDEVKARRCMIEKRMGGVGSVWDRTPGPKRADGGRRKALYRLRGDAEVQRGQGAGA